MDTSMAAQMEAVYKRVDTSLQRLIDSIAAYAPSTSAADELVVAESALSEGLEKVLQHQRKVLQLAELKRIAEANDEKIKTHFRAIAQLRKDLTSIPAGDASSTNMRDISVDDLLSYARYISPTTVPPTFRRQASIRKQESTTATQPSTGIATPPPQKDTTIPPEPRDIRDISVALRAMTEEEKTWLNGPQSHLGVFEPWPSHWVIGNGALGDLQRMVEAGRDPAEILSPAAQVEEDRRRVEEAERERAEEEERVRRRGSLFDTGVAARGRGGPGDGDVFDPDD
ncbi:hypothetical protein LTR62_001165 [Meristemomyces frigidus]|uniref:Mediator of RNA polymerase II transcription subunit 4 n=1 Tax=Meristemomyces frigidus TaxID=1508187 RepID=A0AAN7TNT3_9PEZI|nr:hypothetical protein LTR62_001165 [Meristemomyces frigidus]